LLTAFAFAIAVFAGLVISPAAASQQARAVSLCSALPLQGENAFGLAPVARGGAAARGEPGAMAGTVRLSRR
jgi:hypothetical protein